MPGRKNPPRLFRRRTLPRHHSGRQPTLDNLHQVPNRNKVRRPILSDRIAPILFGPSVCSQNLTPNLKIKRASRHQNVHPVGVQNSPRDDQIPSRPPQRRLDLVITQRIRCPRNIRRRFLPLQPHPPTKHQLPDRPVNVRTNPKLTRRSPAVVQTLPQIGNVPLAPHPRGVKQIVLAESHHDQEQRNYTGLEKSSAYFVKALHNVGNEYRAGLHRWYLFYRQGMEYTGDSGNGAPWRSPPTFRRPPPSRSTTH